MLSRLVRASAAAALVLLTVTAVQAQTSVAPTGFAFGGNLGYYTLSGDDFEGIDSGLGFEGNVRYSWLSGFQILGGVHYASHGIDGLDENINVLSIFVEPRYVFAIGSPTLSPFVGGRAGWVRQSLDIEGIDASADGVAFGGSGGLLFQVAPQVAIETSVMFAAVSFGDIEVEGESVDGTDSSGTTLALQGGIVISLPR
jgi:hypothetical protein